MICLYYSYFVGLNTIKLAYHEYFNTNDRFNHYLHKRYFPIESRSGWRSNYTDFIFASYQMNLFTLYHEMEEVEVGTSRKTFNYMLINILKELVVLMEGTKPPSKENRKKSHNK